MNARTALAAPTLIVVGLLSLTGCSAYDSLVHKQATSTFDDTTAFDDGAEVDAEWIPADATEITVRTSTMEDAADAVILLTSGSALSDCTEVKRHSAPSWVLDGAPDPYEAKTVFACGDWSVVASDDGWFGWTPNSEEERNAAAAE
ncbi:hypothetical protein [Microbacterium phyllosphaerae]|uniref:hypothetical protein n=1 Tax=Microbacterium phyllosphaerae TaxID=124798 RepID=UPI0021679AE8|nr:hypothetical protein [Microbacterium phyllosphaerae]MCS3444136.1 hypothetical protein [Microbacterium phyllosphaerae]